MEEIKEVVVLSISGIFGSLSRLLISPEIDWQKRLAKFLVGIFTAIFIGGFFSILLIKWFDLNSSISIVYATSASGFIVGSGSEQILDMIINYMKKKDEKR